jgi:hypothetical protein
MNKIKLLTATTIFALFAVAVLMHSCKKEGTFKTESNPAMLSGQDVQINNAIQNFMAKVDYIRENPGYKSGEYLSIDSAIWYIDAALNYNYAKANHPFAELHRDTSFVEMGVLESYEAAINEVVGAYGGSLSWLSQKYHAIEGDNKQFIMANVEDMGPLPDNKRSLRIITITGTGTFARSEVFGEDEAYLFNRAATFDCEGESALSAPKIFDTYLNNHYNPDPANNDCRWYFYGSIDMVDYKYEEHQLLNPVDNYLDYKIFAASQYVNPITEVTRCLEWDQELSGIHEMQFYYDYLKELIDEWMASGQNTHNRRFAPSSIIDSKDVTNNYRRTIWHEPKIEFKKRGMICTINSTIPPHE